MQRHRILPAPRQGIRDGLERLDTLFYKEHAMLRDLKNAGFASIVEVIVTAVIFVLATAGILTTVSMLRPHGAESSRKIEAAYIGKGIIDSLRTAVDQGTWNEAISNLAVGTYTLPPIVRGNVSYDVTYTITETTPDIRKLTMNVTW